MDKVIRHTKKFFVALIGFTLVGVGILLLIFPGPGLLVIILGLVVLASEFAWAKTALVKTKGHYEKTKSKLTNKKEV